MSIDDCANGSGWCCVAKNGWRDGRLNRVLSVCSMDVWWMSMWMWVNDRECNMNEWILVAGVCERECCDVWLTHLHRIQFPHSAFARGPRSPALEEGMRVAMGATCECCAGPYAWCSIYVHWFLLISTSDIKRYNNLYLSFHRRW